MKTTNVSTALTHPDAESLRSFAHGQLDDARSREVEQHLEQCVRCCDAIADYSAERDPFVQRLVSLEATSRSSESVPCGNTPAHLIASGNTLDSAGASYGSVPQRVGRFEIRGQVGHGGFGIVLAGYDPQLRREVAIKIPRSGSFLTNELRDRFLREAQAAAALNHPNILPIYEAGEDGQLCYIAAAFCRGPNLAEWLRRRGEPTPLRHAAWLVEKLANAIQHAHGRGVLHRDLKPSNVLLEPAESGERRAESQNHENSVVRSVGPALCSPLSALCPLITDFGLAKLQRDDGDATHSNVVMGSANYMAPEQARGKSREIGPAADVYSLGAILYELLTGRPPIVGESEMETLQRVQYEEPIPPRRLRPKLPRDLETICLTCLHKEPRRRYASASALADDLDRYLRDAPILARPVGPARRVWHWCRRKPAVASLLLLLAFVVVGGVSGLLALWLRADKLRADAESNAAIAAENLRRAEANLNLARMAVDECFVAASQNELLQGDNMQPARQVLLGAALRYYQDFVNLRRDDPNLQWELARAWSHIADITGQIGSRDESLAAYERARSLLEKLVEANPTQRKYAAGLAVVHAGIGLLHRSRGDLASAFQSTRQSIEIRESLVKQHPDDADCQSQLGQSYNNQGLLCFSTGDFAAARGNFERALELQSRLVELYPAKIEYQADLVRHRNNLGLLHQDQGDRPAAAAQFEQALALCEKLMQAKPDAADYRSLLATTCGLLGQLRLALGDHAAARQLHDRACEVLERLVETNPAVGRFQEQLASAVGQLGLLLHELGDYDGALACFDRGHAIREPLVKANPQDAVLHSSIAANAHNKGRTLANSGRYADALPAFQLAAEHQRIAFDKAPEVTRYRLNLSNHLKGVAQASREVGRLVESAAAARERQSLWPDQPEELYAVAKEMCDCVVRVGKNKNDLTADEQAERDQYAQWAVAALRQAVACGFRDLERLKSDPSLETLRIRPDFRDLLESLATKRQSP